MTIEIQQKGELVFLSFQTQDSMFTKSLTMQEARNLRDAPTDMRLIPRGAYEAVIKGGGVPDADFAPLPENFELIALADAQRRNEKTDDAVREAVLGSKNLFPGFKEKADP